MVRRQDQKHSESIGCRPTLTRCVLTCKYPPNAFQNAPMYGSYGPRSNSSVVVTLGHTHGQICDEACQLALAFRTLATVAVYFSIKARREELMDVRGTWKKLFNCWTRSCTDTKHEYSAIGLEGAYEDDDDDAILTLPVFPSRVTNCSDDSIGDERAAQSDAAISHTDIELVRQLADGGFGTVWAGRWAGHPTTDVAIKVMTVHRDAEGDVLGESHEAEFEAECRMLAQAQHPNVVRFYGYGRTLEGNGFIVTELMRLGSVQTVLFDNSQDLDWPQRHSISLQIAIGMEYLHARSIVHRDLKSANVLADRLEEKLVVKVADFGSSRRLRPQRVDVCSPFTGSVQAVPDELIVMTTEHVKGERAVKGAVARMLSARGTLSNAVGTLFWMAPEM